MKYQVQTSGADRIPPIEADEITEKENMFVLNRDGKSVAMFSKSFVVSIVELDSSSK